MIKLISITLYYMLIITGTSYMFLEHQMSETAYAIIIALLTIYALATLITARLVPITFYNYFIILPSIATSYFYTELKAIAWTVIFICIIGSITLAWEVMTYYTLVKFNRQTKKYEQRIIELRRKIDDY